MLVIRRRHDFQFPGLSQGQMSFFSESEQDMILLAGLSEPLAHFMCAGPDAGHVSPMMHQHEHARASVLTAVKWHSRRYHDLSFVLTLLLLIILSTHI